MHRTSRASSSGTTTARVNRESRRYGPHRVTYKWLMELKYYRALYLKKYEIDICDYHPFNLYKKFIEKEEEAEDINSEEEEDATEEEVNGEIHVKKVDLNTENNAKNHHTSDYKCTKDRIVDGKSEAAELVVRRGAPFKINITFDRKYDAKLHDLKIKFKLGMDPLVSRGTDVTIMVDEERKKFDDSGKWQAYIANKMPSKEMEVEILSPPDCIIGEWDLHIYTISKDKRGTAKELHYKHDIDVYILLNPWCKEDAVYFPYDPDYDTDVDPREEYVLNPVGGVYKYSPRAIEWRFGQFDEGIMKACLVLVRRFFRGAINYEMGDPIRIAMAISSMVNSNDNDGVLVGRWDGEYDDGERPGSWAGSTKILKEFAKTGNPVKYGQCWVFSAVTVTVCRALGLPCRSVTNIGSAHDVDATLEIEKIILEDGKTESLHGDSVWNFHVWNEVWMARNDIGDKRLHGWQAIDATPQERSDGIFKCGPCPVVAVKKGLTYLPYETKFVFAEVNADMVYYKQTAAGLQRVRTNKRAVGERQSTKKPDGEPMTDHRNRRVYKRYDVTDFYKHAEGSHDERFSVVRALRYADKEVHNVNEEVSVDIAKKEGETIGDDIIATATVRNNDKEKGLKIKSMKMRMNSTTYTGSDQKEVKTRVDNSFFIPPDEKKEFSLKATWKDYEGKNDMLNYSIDVVVEVDKSGNTYPENKVVVLEPALLMMSADPASCKEGEDVKVTVEFTNPLPMTLTKCILKIDDEKFEDIEDIKVNDKNVIQANETVKISFRAKSLRAGKGVIIAVLDTKELPDIHGSVDIPVYK